MSPQHAYARQYQQTSVQSAVLDATPHQLVTLMLSGARSRLKLAAACMDIGDLPRKGKALSEAGAIIGELDATLNREAGGEVADGLAALYDYALRRLVEANAGNQPEAVREIDELLGEIESAWAAIGREANG